MDPLVTFLKQGLLPKDKVSQRKYIGMIPIIGCPKNKSYINVLIRGHIYCLYILR